MNKRKMIKRRLIFFMIIFSVIYLLLGFRIGWIQFVNGEQYKKQVFLQYSKNNVIEAKRGSIFDRNNNELAMSSLAMTISAEPKKIKEKDRKIIIEELSKTLSIDEKIVKEKLNPNNLSKKSNYVIIANKVDKKIGEQIKKFKKKNDILGLNIEDDTKRYYPNNNLASHIVGFVGYDNNGLDGIEAMMEKYLKGVPGKILGDTDAVGNEVPFTKKNQIDPQNGLNVVLTIDKNIQQTAEYVLDESIKQYGAKEGGFVIIMDPRNGDILAMVSKPDFNLNMPFDKPNIEGISNWKQGSEEATKFLQKTVWRNKALSDTYEPGSTFKAITSAIGLEENKVELDTPVNDYTINVGGHDINCWDPNAHGEEKFYEAVYNSCNPVFVKVASDVGIETFYKYVRSFGFYDKTDIILPGEANSIFHKKPSIVDLAVASFGQRFQVTPIQMITSYCAIANGGVLVKPRIVKELTDSEGKVVDKIETNIVRNVISKDTSEKLRGVLEGVVTYGTGKNAYVNGYKVAGKTGTSETTEEGRYVASFAAFAPANNPVVCVLVAVDHPTKNSNYGGVISAPIAGKLIEETLSYLGVKRTYDEIEEVKSNKLSDLRNTELDKALELIKKDGYRAKIIENKDNKDNKDNGTNIDKEKHVILAQNPLPSTELRKDSIVILYLDKDTKREKIPVPDLKNLLADEAIKKLKEIDLNIRINGNGKVISQSITPGVEVEKGNIISIDLVQHVGD